MIFIDVFVFALFILGHFSNGFTFPTSCSISRKFHSNYNKKSCAQKFGHQHGFSMAISQNPDNEIRGADNEGRFKTKYVLGVAIAVALIAFSAGNLRNLDVNSFLEDSVEKISDMGPYGYLYFAAVYVLAEVLAIPAMPLTASSGYLFGLFPGMLTVLLSATIAACISFFVGRTVLRDWAREKTATWSKWKAIDSAISKQGFKVILLLRMSPLLPFAISNYLYGITSVDFWPYFFATLIGFTPGTFGIVYFGSAGKALLSGGASSLPWYAYAAAAALLVWFGQTIAKVATDALNAIEQEEVKGKVKGNEEPQ